MDSLTRVYLQRLVHSLVPHSYGDAYTALVVEDITTALSHPSHERYSLPQLMGQLKQHFVSSGHGNEWSHVQLIITSLLATKLEVELARYVAFLTALAPAAPTTLNRTLMMANERANRNLMLAPDRGTRNLMTRPERGSRNLLVPERNNRNLMFDGPRLSKSLVLGYLPSLLQTTLPQFRPRSLHVAGYGEPPAELIQEIYPLDDGELMAYIQYTLLGLDSKLIHFGEENLVPVPYLTKLYSRLMELVLECALLYKYLNSFGRSYRGKLNSPIKTAFLTILEGQLNLYVNHINQLFAGGDPPTTLIGVYHEVCQWIYLMRLLYGLVHQLDANGYTFLSQVNELTKFGDLRIRQLSTQIFQEIVGPYYDNLEHWIIKGDLIDELNEFFISFDESATDFNDVIQYNDQMLPHFIPHSVGVKIYQIGKSLIFMNKYCKQLKWINDYLQKYLFLIRHQDNGLEYMTINQISQIVLLQYQELLQKLTMIVQGENQLYGHLVNFKRYYLLQGTDFFESIIARGQGILDDRVFNISSNQLLKILLELINALSVKYSRNQHRIDARLLDIDLGSSGWEAFAIDYRIDDLSINYLLQSQMGTYKQLFLFLWKIRVLGHNLGDRFVAAAYVNKGPLNLLKKSPQTRWLGRTMVVVSCLRFKMAQFVLSLTLYLLFDVIEQQFQRQIIDKLFKLAVNAAQPELSHINPDFLHLIGVQRLLVAAFDEVPHNMNDLTIDTIISTHSEYLQLLANNKLLLETVVGKVLKKGLHVQIGEILDIIYHFLQMLEHYFNLVARYALVVAVLTSNGDVGMDSDQMELESEVKAVYLKIAGDVSPAYHHAHAQLVMDMKSDFDLRELLKSF